MASRSVNKVILIGHLGRDAETKFTPGGASVTRFSVATSHSYKKGEEWVEETNWTNVLAWQKEKLAPYLTKGKQVYVEGRIQTRSYEDKDGKKVYATEVVADQIMLLGGSGSGDSDNGDNGAHRPTPARAGAPASRGVAPAARHRMARPPDSGSNDNFDEDPGITDDDLPF